MQKTTEKLEEACLTVLPCREHCEGRESCSQGLDRRSEAGVGRAEQFCSDLGVPQNWCQDPGPQYSRREIWGVGGEENLGSFELVVLLR